jgi:hypothetical protein
VIDQVQDISDPTGRPSRHVGVAVSRWFGPDAAEPQVGGREEHITRLHITMHDAMLMKEGKTVKGVLENRFDHCLRVPRPLTKHVRLVAWKLIHHQSCARTHGLEYWAYDSA